MKKLILALLLIAAPAFASGLKDYSTTPGDNTFLFPEPMPAGQVNDAARQLMSDVRDWYEAPDWIDLGFAPTRISNNTFTVAGDKTDYFVAGRRIRATDIGTYYGTISSSTYSSPNTSVIVTLDSGNLTSSLTKTAVGLHDPTTRSIPAASIYGALTSVGLTAPDVFNVSNTPITSSGNISLTLAIQPSNTFLAGPSNGVSATPTFRAIVSSDIPPVINASVSASVVTATTISAGTIGGGAKNSLISGWASITGSSGAILKSFNIASVTRTGTGRYNVSFTTPMPDANYAVTCTPKIGAELDVCYLNVSAVKNTGGFQISTDISNGGARDTTELYFMVVGGN